MNTTRNITKLFVGALLSGQCSAGVIGSHRGRHPFLEAVFACLIWCRRWSPMQRSQRQCWTKTKAHQQFSELRTDAYVTAIGRSPWRGRGSFILTWVVVGVSAHDRLHPPVAHDGHDPLDRVLRVDHHALGIVADHPDVVVDLEGLPVDPSRHRTTTERSTSPWCIRSKAASTSSSLISSVTNASRSSRPCR